MGKACKYKCFWDKKIGMVAAYWRVMDGKLVPGRDQYIWSLSDSACALKRPTIMVHKGVIVDGNHRMLALIHNNYDGPILVIESEGQ
jgi:hypothetical protein